MLMKRMSFRWDKDRTGFGDILLGVAMNCIIPWRFMILGWDGWIYELLYVMLYFLYVVVDFLFFKSS